MTVLAKSEHKATRRLVQTVLRVWPEHDRFLCKAFAQQHAGLAVTRETISGLLVQIAAARGETLAAWIADYRYFCERIILPEEMFFRRHGHYRLGTFVEADREVYANAELMTRYMNGLLVSTVLWANHASAMRDFAETYLQSRAPGGNHLEIGPGHGVLLYLALRSGRFASLAGWDVSATSLEQTRHVLALVNGGDRVRLNAQDIYDVSAIAADSGRYDTIVLSEVLEHLEHPCEALEIVRRLLAPGGTAWINVPGNAPAIDHLFLVRNQQQLRDLITEAGLAVVTEAAYPMTGATLERAVRHDLPVNFVVEVRAA